MGQGRHPANEDQRGNAVGLSDIAHARPGASATPVDDADQRWSDLLAQVGREIAGPLTAAQERVIRLGETGRIDRQSLRALAAELAVARRAAMLGQQLARYASGRLRQSHERVDLAQVLRDVVGQRGPAGEAARVRLRQDGKAAEVIADPALLSALIQSVLDWAQPLAQSPIDLCVEHRARPAHARLMCRFRHGAPGSVDRDADAPARADPDSLAWRLAQQIAWAMGLLVERHDDAADMSLALEFPRTVNEAMEGAVVIELDQGPPSSFDSKPLAGSHVLVVAARRDVRQRVRDALRPAGMIIDFVASVEEARTFCSEGLPHALVHAESVAGAPLEELRAQILRDAPDFAFVEIAEYGAAVEMTGFNGAKGARVGFDAIATGLPSTLMFELSKNL
jgi:hypothetical protein